MGVCQYRAKPGLDPVCRTMTAPEATLCPRHEFLVQVEKEARDIKAAKKSHKEVVPNTRIGLLKKGYVFIGSNPCKSKECGRMVEWYRTPNNKNAPFDPMPHEDSPAISHFATCEVYKRAQQMRKAG